MRVRVLVLLSGGIATILPRIDRLFLEFFYIDGCFVSIFGFWL